jgi:predicted transcriptional regulator YheO
MMRIPSSRGGQSVAGQKRPSRQSKTLATAKPRRRGSTSARPKRRDPEARIAFSVAGQLAASLHQLLGPMCEVVVHDFTDLEHSIIQIEGDITHRAIGGAATDLLLEKVATGETGHDLHSYATSLPGGRMMKSSTIFLRDTGGCAVGALCVNLEVTEFVAMRNSLNAFVHTGDGERTNETLSDNIFDTVQSAVAETLYESGRSLHGLSRDETIELVSQLDAKGLFQVKKAVPIVADMLGLSRATVYNYLREGREAHGKRHGNNGQVKA